MRGIGDHGAFVSAGFFGLLATGLYTLQVAKNHQIDLSLFRLTFLGTCGAVEDVTRWIGGMVNHLPSMTQVSSYSRLNLPLLTVLGIFFEVSVKGVSYQSSEPPASPGFRPGTDPSLPPPHLVASVLYPSLRTIMD